MTAASDAASIKFSSRFELVHSGHLVLCTSGKSIGKWLDTPDGPLAQNEPDYELAQGGIGTAETDMQKSNQNKPEWSHES